jgi:hypothetical protein
MNELRIRLISELLQSCYGRYSDAALDFSNLDAKAQNTITISGIFLAGTVAFFTGDSLQKLISLGSRPILVMLGLVTLLLMTSVAFCIHAMWIRDISTKDLSVSTEEVKLILDESSDDFAERYERYLLTEVEQLNQVSSDLHETNRKKAFAIKVGQMHLTLAVFGAAMLLLYLLVLAWRSSS